MYEGQTVTDNGITWKVKNISNADKLSSLLVGGGLPIGCIIPYSASETNPQGFLECNGAAVNREMYPELFNIIGTTYGSGDGSTTFNLPDLRGRFLEGSTTVGTVKEAGLPNITGQYRLVGDIKWQMPTNWDGGGSIRAYSSAEIYPSVSGYTGNTDSRTTGFDLDASRSSSIYGNSDTVQPSSLTVRYIIKAFDTVTVETGSVDYTKFAQDLANRLTREQTPAFNTIKEYTSSGTFIAPVTGWYKLSAKGGGGGGCSGRYSNTSATAFGGGGGGGEGGLNFVYKYIEKDTVISYSIGSGGSGGTTPTTKDTYNIGTNGGNTLISINNATICTGNGGYGGSYILGGSGGSGYFPGGNGNNSSQIPNTPGVSAVGGRGGGCTNTYGSGGSGGNGYTDTTYTTSGANGISGCVWIEYFDPTL